MPTRTEALKVWEEVRPKLQGYDRLEVAGSIRRDKAIVKDVDIVVIPASSAFKCSVINAMDRIFKCGDKRIHGEAKGIKFDFFVATHKSFGASMLWWTGSKSNNFKYIEAAKRRDWKISNNGLKDAKGNYVASEEDDILRALGKQDMIDPRKRR